MKIFYVAAIMAIIMSPMTASADDAKSFEQLSPNGKYVFVMLSKTPDQGGIVDTLKQRYPHSGLYRADNSRKPLWRVNWYASRVHVSSDGIHLVRLGRVLISSINGKPEMTQLAISFYKNGKLTRKYSVGELTGGAAALIKSGDGFKWHKRIAFDDSSEKLDVTTITGQKYLFDIKSGSTTK